MKKRILFVCYANMNRSPTAEELMKSMAVERGFSVFGEGSYSRNCDYEIMSAGINGDSENPMRQDLWDSFETIVAMDGFVKKLLLRIYKPKKEVLNLNIPDIFPRNSPELKEKLRPHLERLLDRNP